MTAVLWTWALVNAALACAAVLTVRGRTAAALVIAGAAVLAVAELVAAATLGFFELVHLLYLHLVVVLPLLGAAVLWRLRRARLPRLPLAVLRVAAALAVLLAPAGAYASFVEPFRLQVERARVPVPPERAGERPLRVAVLADLQTPRVTEYERDAVERLMRERPDVVLIPGDVYQGNRFAEELPALRELARRLEAPGGTFFVQGDTDSPEEMRAIFSRTPVRVLHNDTARVWVRDRSLTIGGVERDYRTPAARAVVGELENGRGRGDVRILLAHRPDAALLTATGSRVDLTVAGHTHGGQVQLPLYGPPVTLSGVPREVGAGGLHTLTGGRRIYVSRGVGVERAGAPRVRFLAPPEISVLELGDP